MPNRQVVLVADDHAEMRKLLNLVLSRRGYDVRLAADGESLKALCNSLPKVDAIVTDVRMPGITGIEALSAVRETHPDVISVVITAFGDDSTHAAAASLGAQCMDKPFDPDDLVDLLDKAFDRKST